MAEVHGILAWIVAVAAGGVLVASSAMAIGAATSRLWLDRAILALLAAALTVAIIGLPLAVAGAPPADPLHLVYGAAVVGLPIGGRYVTRGDGPRRMGRAMTVVSLVTLGVLFRAFTTAG